MKTKIPPYHGSQFLYSADHQTFGKQEVQKHFPALLQEALTNDITQKTSDSVGVVAIKHSKTNYILLNVTISWESYTNYYKKFVVTNTTVNCLRRLCKYQRTRTLSSLSEDDSDLKSQEK